MQNVRNDQRKKNFNGLEAVVHYECCMKFKEFMFFSEKEEILAKCLVCSGHFGGMIPVIADPRVLRKPYVHVSCVFLTLDTFSLICF